MKNKEFFPINKKAEEQEKSFREGIALYDQEPTPIQTDYTGEPTTDPSTYSPSQDAMGEINLRKPPKMKTNKGADELLRNMGFDKQGNPL